MALPGLLAAILGGVGQGVGGGGQAVAGAREKQEDRARQATRDALVERQVNLAEQQYANERNDREVLATEASNNPALAPHAPLLRIKGGADVVKWLADLNAKEKARADEIADRNAAADVIARAPGAPGRPTSALKPGEDPEAGAFIGSEGFRAPMGMNDVRAALARTKLGPALFKEMYPQDKFGGVPLDQDLTNLGTGEVVRPGTPKPTEPKQATQGAEYVAAVNALEAAEKLARENPNDKAAQNAVKLAATRVDRLKPMPFQYGGGIAGPSGQGPIVKPEAPPVAGETATAIAAAGGARQAAKAALALVDDADVQQYLGPYGQYRSEVQRRTPFEMAGKVPPSVIALEQHNAKVKNYTIRLITGAAVRKDEEGRIVSEIVDTNYPPDEYRQRMQMTLANIDYLEKRVIDLALRGDQKALSVAQELGLNTGVKLGGPAGVGNTTATPQPQPPKAPAQTFDALPPAAQYKDRFMRNANGQRVKSDGKQWVPVP